MSAICRCLARGADVNCRTRQTTAAHNGATELPSRHIVYTTPLHAAVRSVSSFSVFTVALEQLFVVSGLDRMCRVHAPQRLQSECSRLGDANTAACGCGAPCDRTSHTTSQARRRRRRKGRTRAHTHRLGHWSSRRQGAIAECGHCHTVSSMLYLSTASSLLSSLRVSRLRDEMANDEPLMTSHMEATVQDVMDDILKSSNSHCQ